MAFDNPLRSSVLSGLDDPANEFGAGFDIETKVDQTPQLELGRSSVVKEDEKKAKKQNQRARAMDAIASALAVFTSKDPGRAAQAMIEMRMQMVQNEKERQFKEQQLMRELTARQEGREYERDTQLEVVEARVAGEQALQESGWEVEQKKLDYQDRLADENATEADRVEAYNAFRDRVFAIDPGAPVELANQYAACAVAGGGPECNTMEMETLRTQMTAADQRAKEDERAAGKASIINAQANASRVRLQEIELIAETNPVPVTRMVDGQEVPVLDPDTGAPMMRPMPFEEASRLYNQSRGITTSPGSVEPGLDTPEAKQEAAADLALSSGNAIKQGDNTVIGSYLDSYNASGQTDDVFVSLFSELDAPLNEVAKHAEERGIPRSRVLQAQGEAYGKMLAEQGIKRGREGDAAIKKLIATNPDITRSEASTILYYAQEAQQSLGSYLWDATLGGIHSGLEERINQ